MEEEHSGPDAADYALPRSSKYMATVTGAHQSGTVGAAASDGGPSSAERQRRRTTPSVQMEDEIAPPVECCLYTLYWPHPMTLFLPQQEDTSPIKSLHTISKSFF
eukprot:gb/GECG01008556.1/.p1 GENE.gb/GECG01008556.1/~~gb/GECG01008556.1/.p1  ORF type:complete len:105 (+),score=11.31 gb/GECG01008556.1/:1-315(+)